MARPRTDLDLGGAYGKPPTEVPDLVHEPPGQPLTPPEDTSSPPAMGGKERLRNGQVKAAKASPGVRSDSVTSSARGFVAVLLIIIVLFAAVRLSGPLLAGVLLICSIGILITVFPHAIALPKRKTRSKEIGEQPEAPGRIPPEKGFPALRYKLYTSLNRPMWIPKPNKAERRELRRDRSRRELRVQGDSIPNLTVAYFGVKGASATTATTVHTASVLADETRGTVVVSDFNPAQGSSAVRLGREAHETVTLRGLLAKLNELSSFGKFIGTLRPTPYGVRVVSADSIVDPTQHLNDEDVAKMLEAIRKNCEYHHIDTGSDVTTGVTLQVAKAAKVFIFTANVAVRDSLRLLAIGMETLRKHGFGEKVDHSVVVISNIPKGKKLDDYMHYVNVVDVDHNVTREIPFMGAFVGVPHDPIIALDGEVDLEKLNWDTYQSYLDLNNAILEQALHLKSATNVNNPIAGYPPAE